MPGRATNSDAEESVDCMRGHLSSEQTSQRGLFLEIRLPPSVAAPAILCEEPVSGRTKAWLRPSAEVF